MQVIRTVKNAAPATGGAAHPRRRPAPAAAARNAVAFAGLAVAITLSTSAVRTSPWIVLALAALGALACWRPLPAVLLAAALTPLVTIAMSLGLQHTGVWSEALVLAVLGGWLARILLAGPPALPRGVAVASAVFGALVICSLIVVLAEWRVRLSPGAFWAALAVAVQSYAVETDGLAGVVRSGMRVLLGLGLLLMAMSVCREPAHRRQVLRMTVVAAAAVATFNLYRLAAGALRSEAPWNAFLNLLQTVRLSLPYPDVNAAGSYFALTLIVACALALTSTARWPLRAVWVPVVALNASGLWISQSRAAVLSVIAAVCAIALLRARRLGLVPVAAVVLLAVALVWIFPNPVLDRSAVGAVGIRAELARVAWRLTGTAPVFGIGIGQFYERSAAHIEHPDVRRLYARENAHNNFLQYLAELGVVGLAAFLWLLWRAVIARPPEGPPADLRLHRGVQLAVAAFLLTCLGGHPLLVDEVSFTFWSTLGVLAAGHAIAPGRPRALATWRSAAVIVVVLVAVMPWRVRTAAHDTNLDHVGHGVSAWEREEDGTRYRRMSERATLFVPRDAQLVDIPFRLEAGGHPVTLEIRFRGRVADRVTVASPGWQAYRLTVPVGRSDPLYLPVELHVVDGDADHVVVGRVAPR